MCVFVFIFLAAPYRIRHTTPMLMTTPTLQMCSVGVLRLGRLVPPPRALLCLDYHFENITRSLVVLLFTFL